MSKGKIALALIIAGIALAGHGFYKAEEDCAKGVSLIAAYLTMEGMLPIQSQSYKFKVRQCLGARK